MCKSIRYSAAQNRQLIRLNRPAFTLVELAVTSVLSTIVVLSAMVMMVDQTRGWHDIYSKVHGDVAVDSTFSRRVFERTCRKATERRAEINEDGNELIVFYFSESAPNDASWPDRYARFHISNDELMLVEGDLTAGEWIRQAADSHRVLARNVSELNFAARNNAIQMNLKLDDGENFSSMVCSASRHN
ncbi:hypothetical protein STSP2_02778 [Anaerohalosphaera lusitana]|uniref:Prepilin-type N-terminal cleavage/methylation domain-containing protein n=1 Tax=Anaerohalosphaera lusitana TaxID=1936003 RepID=A0A1U9NP14_9BACT|nr:hypothetical protein [Anaerohalosphaera lusitana]AQT69585.1 hypothetical protein STSP2_02778 [Anaerohalosphaera lusitana]